MNNGLTTKESSKSFENTISIIKDRIQAKNLRLFATINHHENADKNGFELAPTTLLIFGNPNVGAPLMQLNQSIGIDLPMKMLITQKNEIISMSYNDPRYLKERHSLPQESTVILDKVSMMFNELTDV